MSSNFQDHQINIMKMSTFDEEMWRENNLLRSILFHIEIPRNSEDQSNTMAKKRFKSSI